PWDLPRRIGDREGDLSPISSTGGRTTGCAQAALLRHHRGTAAEAPGRSRPRPNRPSRVAQLAVHWASTRKNASDLRPPYRSQELLPLRTREFFPTPGAQSVDSNVHDPRSVQLGHSIAKSLTHAPDLPIASLRQNDAKLVTPHAHRPTGLRPASKNNHTPRQMIQKGLAERTIDLHEVLSFVSEFGTEDLVDDVAVVRQQNETGRILVQPPDWKNPLTMPDLGNDISRDMRFARCRDTDRLMILDVEI